jgi:hypothetical protein
VLGGRLVRPESAGIWGSIDSSARSQEWTSRRQLPVPGSVESNCARWPGFLAPALIGGARMGARSRRQAMLVARKIP